MNPARLVKSDGTCGSCDKKADNQIMSCFACEEDWHVIECTAGPDLATKTFLDKSFKVWKAAGSYKSIVFICPPCRDARILQQDIVKSNRMSAIEDKMSSVQEDLKFIKDSLARGPERAESSDFPVLPQAAYPVKSSDAVIVINNEDKDQPIDRKIIKAASYSSKAAVTSTYQNKKGNTVVVCESVAAKDRLAANLKESVKDRPVLTPAQRLPTIRIAGMEEDFSKDKILEEVQIKNQEKGIIVDNTNFKVLFTRPHAKNPNLFQAIVRVSNEVRAAIHRAGDQLYVDLKNCHVYNHLHIRRCNNCQGYNHFQESCTKDPRCANCAENHRTDTCNTQQVQCANCVDNHHENTGHKASDPTCNSYTSAQKKLEQTIGFYKTKN